MFAGMTATETKWRERVRDWKRSGQSIKEFSQGQPFQASSLTWWNRRLGRLENGSKRTSRVNAVRRRRSNDSSATIPMVRVVRSTTTPRESLGVVVEVGSVRVVVQAGFDAGLLNAVVHALRGAA